LKVSLFDWAIIGWIVAAIHLSFPLIITPIEPDTEKRQKLICLPAKGPKIQ
jgi:hypothetical protein